MASNVTLDPTTTSGGAVVSTDELSDGTHVQQVKIGTVAAGVYTGISASNPLPVTGTVATSVGNTVTVTGTVAATQSGAWAVSDGAVVAALSGKLDVSVGSTVVVSNGGTFAVQAAQAGAWVVSDGAVVSKINTVLGNSSLVTSGAIRVNLDSSNVSIGGGTQYSVGTSGVESTGVGNLMLGVRDDVLATLSSGQGQVVPLRVDSTGALWVAAAPGDAETTDGATVHSLGVTRQVNVGFVAIPNELTVGANTVGMAGMTENRELYVSLRDLGAGISTAGALQVHIDSSNIALGAGGTQYSVGTSGLTSTGVGNLMLASRDDALSTLASGEGQVVGLRVDSTGALWVNNVGTSPSSVSDGAVVGALNAVTSGGALLVSIQKDDVGIGGGTQYSEGTVVASTTGVGNLLLAKRDDTLGTLSESDGQVVGLREDANGALWVHKYKSGSVVDSNNTTSGTIAANGDFIGGATDLLGYTSVAVSLYASEPSTTNGMKFQFSQDATNWDDTYSYTYSGSDTAGARRFQFPVTSRYFRVNWTQGPSAATARIQTILHTENLPTSIHRISDNVSPDRSSNLVKAAIVARQSGAGDFVPVQSTNSGNLKVAVEEWDVAGPIAVSDGAVVARLGQKLEVSVGSTVTVTGTVTANAGTGQWAVSDGAVVSLLSGTLTVSDGAVVGILNSAADTTGAFIVRQGTSLESIANYHDQTVTTGSIVVSAGTVGTFAAGGAGVYNYITDVTLTNSSSTNTVVQLRNGASGAVFWTFPVPANGGVTAHFTTPLKQPSANTALAFDPLTAVTTLYISISGFQAAG